MTSKEKSIQAQLKNDFDSFQFGVYTGGVVPENFIELFKNGVKALAPQSHKVLARRIKAIASRQPNELFVEELREAIMVIVNTPMDRLYDFNSLTFEGVMEWHSKFESFILEYNQHVENFQQKLTMKQTTLQNLTNGSGMRVVPNIGKA